jgi:murein L,D-transpeptidase YafK
MRDMRNKYTQRLSGCPACDINGSSTGSLLSCSGATALYYSGMFDSRRFLLLLGIVLLPISARSETGLPGYLIRVPESVATVFVAETSTAKFHRFEQVEGQLQYAGSHYMSIGINGAGKEKDGDRRTPLGIYFVTEQLDTQRLHEKYGVTAYVLDYPNAWDQRHRRSGDGIWVHGVDPAGGERPPRDTDGCIALPNDELRKLEGTFVDNVTPVLVARALDWSSPEDRSSIAAELEHQVRQWSASRVGGDLHAYLSMYDNEFERWALRKEEWSTLSLNVFAERSIVGLRVDDLLILGYPDAADTYLTRFTQTVQENDRQTVSTKRLYWRRTAQGELKVIAEDEG